MTIYWPMAPMSIYAHMPKYFIHPVSTVQHVHAVRSPAVLSTLRVHVYNMAFGMARSRPVSPSTSSFPLAVRRGEAPRKKNYPNRPSHRRLDRKN
jgi:hypothetical protein